MKLGPADLRDSAGPATASIESRISSASSRRVVNFQSSAFSASFSIATFSIGEMLDCR